MNFDEILATVDGQGNGMMPEGWGQGRALFVRDFAFDRALGPRCAEQGERKRRGGNALNWNHGFGLSKVKPPKE